MKTKKISILGSTGSIGLNTLRVIDAHSHLKVYAIAAHSNIELLERQALKYKPEKIVVYDKNKAKVLKERLPNFKILTEAEGLKEISTDDDVDFVMLAMTGIQGLNPAIEAIKLKKRIGLANKELLVCAGELISTLAAENGVELLPVDSEHSAIFQCLNGEKKSQINRLILTASGGPFRNFTKEDLENASLNQALSHPNWKMGQKNTIDSSTLMNKGLEVIEAHWLFKIPVSQIEVCIHPQSIVHSMVEYKDRSIISQMSYPSMLLPIQYALTYPDRLNCEIPKFDFKNPFSLDFHPPDFEKFPCLELAYFALKEKKSYSCYLNAANEILVDRFLGKEISWIDISRKLKKLITSHKPCDVVTLEAILNVDQQAREDATRI